MQRCNSCNGILTKTDVNCYVCGEPVPGARRQARRAKIAASVEAYREATYKVEPPKVEAKPISRLSNLLFVGSLVLTAVAFLSEEKLPIALSLGLSLILFSMRLFDGRFASKESSPGCESLVPHSTTDH